MPPRRIWLASGTYHWRAFTAHRAHEAEPNWRSRQLYLRSGWYRWTDCIFAPAPNPDIYLHHSALLS